VLIVKQKNMVYIDPPKTASSTIETVLQKIYTGSYMYSSSNKFEKHCRDIPDEAKNYKRIISVRNPYSRIVSHYFYHIARGVLDKVVPNCIPNEHTEENFDIFLDYHISLLSEDSYTKDDNVFRLFPLWKYLEPIGWDTHIKQESLLQDLVSKNIIPEPVLLPTLHKNSHVNWKTLLSKERREKVKEWAGIDFNLFGYKK